MFREARKSSPVSTYVFRIKVQRILIGVTHLMYDCRFQSVGADLLRSVREIAMHSKTVNIASSHTNIS